MDLYIEIADEINKDISAVLLATLQGTEKKYRTPDGFIRWGLVEADIHATVMRHLTTDNSKENKANEPTTGS
jgi:predicted transcriptional regulator with HTH domain